MRLATELGDLQALGAEVVALSVDSPGRSAAFAARWRLPFPILSDPGGAHWLRPLELWNDSERGGIAVPSLTLVLPSGEEAYHHRSRDFADRPPDTAIFASLERAGLPPLDPPPPAWRPEVDPEEHPDAVDTRGWTPYMRGVRAGAATRAGRLEGAAAEEAVATASMAVSFLAAWARWRGEDAPPDPWLPRPT